MNINLLIATYYNDVTEPLKAQLSGVGFHLELTLVSSLDEMEKELLSDRHHGLVTEFTFCGFDIWEIAKWLHSEQLSAHLIPIFLVKDGLEAEMAPYLAKSYGINPLNRSALGQGIYQALTSKGGSLCEREKYTPTVLVIDDDERSIELMTYYLKDGYEVVGAGTGESGLSLWRQSRHDLVFLDYMLPGLQGNEVLAAIMAEDRNQTVIVMTAFDAPERCKNLILNGASEYLSKPFDFNSLPELCRTLLERARMSYQMHYAEAKASTLRNLVWLLDYYLGQDNVIKAKQVLTAIKRMSPGKPTEDEQLLLLNRELPP